MQARLWGYMEDSLGARALDLVPLPFAALTGVIGLYGLYDGWSSASPVLSPASEDYIDMVPSTALCFMLMSGALILGWFCDGAWRARVAWGMTFAVVVVALVNLSSFLLLASPGIDGMLLGDAIGADHMAVPTAIGMLMGCYCILALMAPENPDPDGPVYFAVAGLSTSICVIAGHAFDATTIYDLGVFHGMSALTAMAFCSFFIAVLAFPSTRTGEIAFDE